jgi:diguanylate cyclase (GGDEF)-like protein/PAS domain S-box-containing protein
MKRNRESWVAIWLLPIMVLLIIGSTLSWFAADEYTQTIEREYRALESSDRIADAQLSSLLRTTEKFLDEIASEQTALTQAQRKHYDAVLEVRKKQLPEIRTLSVVNASGRIELSTNQTLRGFDASQRDYFIAHHSEPLTPGIRVSRPFKSSTSGDVLIALTVAILDADQKFQGVVVASVSPHFLDSLLTQIRPDRDDGAALIFNRSGDVVYRVPEPDKYVATSIADSNVAREHFASTAAVTRHIGTSLVDGKRRLYAISRVGSTGLSIGVSHQYDQVVGEWRRNLVIRAAIFLLTAALVIGLTRIAQRRDRERHLAENQLSREKDFSDSLIDLLPGLFYVLDRDGRFIRWNKQFEVVTGYSVAEMAGLNGLDIIAPSDRKLVSECIRQVFIAGHADVEARLTDRHGASTPYYFNGRGTVLDGITYHIGTGTDISARIVAETRTRLMASVFSNSTEAIVITDADNHIVTVNDSFSRLTGYTPDEVIGRNPRILSAGKTPVEVYQRMWNSLQTTNGWAGELWDRRKSGEAYPKWLSISVVRDAQGQITNYIANFVDISERKASEERVLYLAHHDPLTDLPNRYSLNERLPHALRLCRRNRQQLALMLIDLDGFKAINDTLGHQMGDRLLVTVASRLREAVRDSDIVARLGGDEFVVVLPAIESVSDAAKVAAKIVQSIANPYFIDEHELRSSPSIGICIFPDDGFESADLLKKSDVAMYHAKAMGRANFQFFTANMQATAAQRVRLDAEMRVALKEEQFILHYQPQLDLRTGQIVGVEALVRWQHPVRGLVAPGDFIPLAEETGLILPLGDWVLREACRQLRDWAETGLAHIMMSVNLSALQFRDATLSTQIAGILVEYGLDPETLDLEVTESMSMASPESSVAIMRELTAQGLSLSIDDFGTGHSSLSYLKLFPLRTLKIDRTFVKDIETDESDAAICDITVLLAHRLGLDVVAEGVETAEQMKYLISIGCEKVQGYLISKPLPAAQAEAFIRSHLDSAARGTVDIWRDGGI